MQDWPSLASTQGAIGRNRCRSAVMTDTATVVATVTHFLFGWCGPRCHYNTMFVEYAPLGRKCRQYPHGHFDATIALLFDGCVNEDLATESVTAHVLAMAILEVLDDAPPASDRKERLVIITAAGTLEKP